MNKIRVFPISMPDIGGMRPFAVIMNGVDPKTGELRDDLRFQTTVTCGPAPWSLSIEQMMAMSGKTRRWIFAHCDELPWVKRITRKTLRGDEESLQRWIASRR